MEEKAGEKIKGLKIDPAWEFAAPQYYDFCVGEREDEKIAAEFWFVNAATYDASPHAGKSKPVVELLNLETQEEAMEEVSNQGSQNENKENETDVRPVAFATSASKMNVSTTIEAEENAGNKLDSVPLIEATNVPDEGPPPSTPTASQDASVRDADRRPFSEMLGTSGSRGSLPAKQLQSEGWMDVQVAPPATMPLREKPSLTKKLLSTARKKAVKDTSVQVKTPCSPDKPATKKQKLEGGRLRQIKDRFVRPNDPPPTATKPQEFKFSTDKRSRLYGGAEQTPVPGRAISPFVSMAEKIRSFQCKTPERFHLNFTGHHEVDDHEKRKMKLTKPKTPEFETSHRVRTAKVKSTAELEAEMLAKVPKFKARPVPKRNFETPHPSFVPKSAPAVPEFQEFHFRTTERALQHKGANSEQRAVDTTDRIAVDKSSDSQSFPEFKQRSKAANESNGFCEPREPHFHTAARVRATTVKSREELEIEELAKIPRFKARPLDRRIFESRGDIGIYRNGKREVTIPEEFHFATVERGQQREIPLEEQLDRMSLHHHGPQETLLKSTVPEPFNLETENRGVLKRMRFLQELLLREHEDMQARVPRAHPLPFTTDVPAIPPKPEPKESTRLEPFQLESVDRHEEELRRAEERKRAAELEAALKAFRAQPNLSVGPVFVPARSRKPLTEVEEFNFQLETRALERAEFDQRVAEKHNQYKRFREEYESARKAEEERSIKALRREMVPHARPMPVYHRPFVPQRSTKELTRPVSPQFNFPPSRMPSSARRRSIRRSSASFMALQRRMGKIR